MTESLTLVKHGQSLEHLSEVFDLNDDIFQQIFSYLDAASLIHVGQVCSRFRYISSSDYSWMFVAPQYKHRRKEKYIHRKKRNLIVQRRSLLKELGSKVNSKFQAYIMLTQGVFLPISVVTGLVYISIIAPLLLDGVITLTPSNFWYTTIPAIVLIIIPFIIAVLTLVHSAILLYPVLNIILKRSPSIDDSQILSCLVIIGWVLWIPLIVLGILIRLLLSTIDGTTTYAFRVSFLPVHVYAVIYLWMSVPVFFCARNISNFDRSYTVAYGAGIAINAFVAVQAGMISAKLDQVFDSYWFVVLTPMWLLFVVLMSLCVVLIPFIYRITSFLFIEAFLIFVSTACIPFVIWLILLCVRLDLFASFHFVFGFIPLYCGILYCIGGTLGFLFAG